MDRLIEQARQEFARRRAAAAPPTRACAGCGAQLTGRALKWCSTDCRNAGMRPPVNRRWTRELVIERIQEWHRRFGRPPAVSEWNPSTAKKRGYDDALAVLAAEPRHWPSVYTVKQHFPTWPAALRAAGLQPNRHGRRSHTAPSRTQLIEQAAA